MSTGHSIALTCRCQRADLAVPGLTRAYLSGMRSGMRLLQVLVLLLVAMIDTCLYLAARVPSYLARLETRLHRP